MSSYNRRRSGRLQGKDPELEARLSSIENDLGFLNPIIPGMVPILACNIENMQNMNKLYDMSDNTEDPLCFAAKSKTRLDSLTMADMRKCEDIPQFEEQMQQEIQRMFKNDVFRLYPKHQVPRYKSILPVIWSFRRTRTPDGSVYRHRARLCVHGGIQQEGIDFFDTYAPVVSTLVEGTHPLVHP